MDNGSLFAYNPGMKAAGKNRQSVAERKARLEVLFASGRISKEHAGLLHVREATIAEKAYVEGYAAERRFAKKQPSK